MKKMIWTACAAFLLFAGTAQAQAEMAATADMAVAPGKEEVKGSSFAATRAANYARTFGLDADTEAKLAKMFMQGQDDVAPIMVQMEEMKAKMNGAMEKYDNEAESMLNEKQRAQLETMRKEGSWDPSAGCCSMTTEAKASCHGKEKEGAAAGGCCAGKAGAKASAKK